MTWERIHHRDTRGVELADRHYSRQTIGAPEYTRPGFKVTLACFDGPRVTALWASQKPKDGIERSDGLTAWDCSIFRNESSERGSDLIRAAVAITLGAWGDPPPDGFVTTVDPYKVAPTMVRGYPVWGWVFYKAGFKFLKITSARKLHMLQLPRVDLLRIEPKFVEWEKGPIFQLQEVA